MAKAFLNKKNFVRKRSTNMTLILNSAYDVNLYLSLIKSKIRISPCQVKLLE